MCVDRSQLVTLSSRMFMATNKFRNANKHERTLLIFCHYSQTAAVQPHHGQAGTPLVSVAITCGAFLLCVATACGAPLISQLGSVSSMALNALVLMSLGADHSALLSAVASSKIDCPVYLTETYGIIGFDEASQAHVELMEKGRGSEYGFQGGSGGQGCVIIAFEGARAGHTSDFQKMHLA